MENINFRKIKIIFKKDNKELDTQFFENLLEKKDLSFDEKWFVRGCKHITERHYAEAIKRFQLSKNTDSILMILAVSFKLADKFLFDEYYKEIKIKKNYGEMFEKFGIKPFIKFDDKEYKLDLNLIEKLKEALNWGLLIKHLNFLLLWHIS